MNPKSRWLERGLQLAVSNQGASDDFLCDNLWRVNWKKLGFPYYAVYVIGPHKRWPMKIGFAANVATRLTTLQCAVWEPIRVHHCFLVRSRGDAIALERRAHADLVHEEKALNGEWFDLRPEDAEVAVEFAALGEGIDLFREPPCGRDHPSMVALNRHFERRYELAFYRTIKERTKGG
jgi:hypothetical protein